MFGRRVAAVFFPYLSYFQLLAHVDVFVVYDDT